MVSVDFFIDLSVRPYPAYNRITPGLGKGGPCVGLTNFSPSCANCLESWGPQPLETLTACLGLYRDCFTFNKLDWIHTSSLDEKLEQIRLA
jgi:hypothetical protein